MEGGCGEETIGRGNDEALILSTRRQLTSELRGLIIEAAGGENRQESFLIDWSEATASRLGLESTFRPLGGLKKSSEIAA